MSYQIKLPVFEGPFDLLLYLIRKHEVDVYDIPVAEITRQYLEYIELMQLLDLDVAGEFIEMVATLMLIKVRMLLPAPPTEDGEEPEDPRAELVAQLLEYQQFKEVSRELAYQEAASRQLFPRVVPKSVIQQAQHSDEELVGEATLFDLLTALKNALDNMPKVTEHHVTVIKVTIEGQVQFLFREMAGQTYVLFRDLVRKLKTRMEVIVTFMALLDLIRLQFLTAKQSQAFGEIRLVPLKPLELAEYYEIRDKELIEADQGDDPSKSEPGNSETNTPTSAWE